MVEQRTIDQRSFNCESIKSQIASLLEEQFMEHGSVNGRTICGGGSELWFYRKNGHGCRRCLAREKLALIAKVLYE